MPGPSDPRLRSREEPESGGNQPATPAASSSDGSPMPPGPPNWPMPPARRYPGSPIAGGPDATNGSEAAGAPDAAASCATVGAGDQASTTCARAERSRGTG